MNIVYFALNDLKLTFRNKITTLILIFMPLFMIFLMGYAMKPMFNLENGFEKFPILYINEDSGTIGKSFDKFIRSQGNSLFDLKSAQYEKVKSSLSDGYPLAVYVPKDLSSQIADGKKAGIEIISSGHDQLKDDIALSFIQSFIDSTNSYNALVSAYHNFIPSANPAEGVSVVNSIQAKYGNNFILPRKIESDTQKVPSFSYFSASMLIFFLLSSGMGIGTNILTERKNKTLLRINSYPVTKSQYLLGKILGNSVIALLQSLIIIIFAKYAFHVDWGNSYAGLSLTIMLMIFISSAISIIFSSLLNTAKALTSFLSILFWMMTFISGGFTPLPILEPLADFTINKWAFESLMTLMTGGTLENVKGFLLILAAIASILWLLGIMLYNRRFSYE